MDKEEIICISSDDEDQEQNKTESKQRIAAKLSEDNASHVNTAISLIDHESVKGCVRKRKASEISNDMRNNSDCETSSKVVVCEIKDNVTYVGKEEKEDEVANKKVIKPHLVVKEKRTISPVEEDIFPMFINLCLQRDHSKEMKLIVNKLKRRYEQLDPIYANCEAFIDFLKGKRNDILCSKSKLYIHIAEVMNEMKRSYKGKSNLLLNGESSVSTLKKLNINNESEESSVPSSSMLHMNNSTDNDEESHKQYDAQEKIKLLLKTMKKCERYIKQLEQAEVDFETGNNSNYIKLEKYKCRMVQLFEKYCKYTGDSPDAGRQYLRPKHFSTTGIVAVDHAITSFINSKISKSNNLKKIGAFTNALIFPDYNDILKCVTKCNEMYNLGLDNKNQQQIAKKAFTELGEYLQRCRRNDYWDTFSLFLENEEEDPALKDPVLTEKLLHNKEVGEKKLLNIFEEYVNKQIQLKDQATDCKTSLENEQEEDEDEDEDEEKEDDDDDDDDDTPENEDDDENDDILKSDANFDIEGDRISTNDDSESTDKDEVCTSTRNTSIKTSILINKREVDLDVQETQKTQRTEVMDRLKNDEVNDFKKTKLEVTNMCNTKIDFSQNSVNKNGKTIEDVNSSPTVIRTKEEDGKPNGINADQIDDNSLQIKEEKPLLRVRSFAKPPTTWEDVYEKINKHNVHEHTAQKLIDKDVIDLTQISPKNKANIVQCATFQIGSNVPPVKDVNGKYIKFIKPASKSVINVKNITNNYVQLSPKGGLVHETTVRSDSFISSQQIRNTKGSTTIHLSSKLSINQQAKTNNKAQHLQGNQNSTTVQISQSNSDEILSNKNIKCIAISKDTFHKVKN